MPDVPLTWPFVAWLIGAFIAGYLVGSIPFGFLITRAAGAGDIRSIGSGNIGATNVLRTGRKWLALATLIADIAKGALPVALAYWWFGPDLAVMAGAGAILGHCFPIWLRFVGGKGVATAAGVILGLAPSVFILVLLAFVFVAWSTRYVSAASITAALSAPVVAYILHYYQAAELYAFVALLVIIKHWGNIKRLRRGTENKLSFGGSKS